MNKTLNRIACLARVTLLCMSVGYASGAFAQPYNAGTDYSTTQGYRNWYYLDWTGTTYEMMTYGTNAWGWQSWHSSQCVDGILVDNWGHPPSCSSHVSTRGWMSPAHGKVHITGNAHKLDPGGGDGVQVSIFKNQEQLWVQDIAYNDTTGYDFDLTVEVEQGDFLYFGIYRLTDAFYDSTYFNPTVDFNSDT